MNADQFVNWLQGYLDADGDLNKDLIKKKLAQVNTNSFNWPPPYWYKQPNWPWGPYGTYCTNNGPKTQNMPFDLGINDVKYKTTMGGYKDSGDITF